MSTGVFEAFSVSHAAILNGSTGAEAADIYGVREGSVSVDSDSYDNTGDDAVLSNWFWFNYAEVTISSGYIPFQVVSLLTGAPITSTGDNWSMPLWTQSSLNQPSRPVLIRVPSKDSAGAVRTMDIVLFRVQFMPISFDGPTYKDGLVLNYSGRAVVSPVDETGTNLPEKAIGRLLNKPAQVGG
jgi:hypothetical protein